MNTTKKTLIAISIVIIVIVGGFFLKLLSTGAEIIDKTLDADNVLYNYEWFKQQNQDFNALVIKIKVAEDAVKIFKEDAGKRKDWTFEDKTESSRLQSISSGLKYQIEDLVAKYNARSEMANRNIFKDGVLPTTLTYK